MNKIVVFSNGDQQLIYYSDFFAWSYFEQLKEELPWQQNEIRVFGKTHQEPRLTCWFGPAYAYSSIAWPKTELPELVNEIKWQLQDITNFSFNAVLANFYRSGDDSMGWHSDNEPEMDKRLIASVTFGGKRVFKMRNRNSGQKIDLELADSSLLLMHNMQDEWQHAVPKSRTRNAPRINLTYRNILA